MIVYIEAEKHPLQCRIKILQYRFWSKVNSYVDDNPGSAIAKVLKLEEAKKLSYVTYYSDLLSKFSYCQMSIEAQFRAQWHHSINRKAETDEDSKLGTYIRVNPELKPFVPIPQNIMEGEGS